jgi:hypothetical protein
MKIRPVPSRAVRGFELCEFSTQLFDLTSQLGILPLELFEPGWGRNERRGRYGLGCDVAGRVDDRTDVAFGFPTFDPSALGEDGSAERLLTRV